ncbi:unnamed protein product [Dracunculus medinensis]|uniref:DUF3699 domain-containing protein n=1 Tax=Dracunculus medinensis TaxID=318479 RepID=A0A0N4UAY9_DRAME|nr:unnamed protein product [Dracunculus medinensis]
MAENDGQPFDINLPPAHQYLHLREENLLTNADKYEDANVIINVSFLDLSIVLLPTQKFPYFTQAPLQISQFREAANSNSLIALQPIVRERTTNIATLIQVSSFLIRISKFEELNDGVIIEAVGRQRCKMKFTFFHCYSLIDNQVSFKFSMPYGSVLVLEDRELLPFSQLFVPSSCTRLPPKEVQL